MILCGQAETPIRGMVARLAFCGVLAIVLTAGSLPSASADVFQCGGQQPLGMLTCTTTGPAMINGNTFVGDGGSAAQLQWRGSTVASAPGLLQVSYTYSGIFNTLFSKIGLRLSVSQPTCQDPYQSRRDWVDPSSLDGFPQRIEVSVRCAGPLNYTITSRAATYSLGGSYIGQVILTDLTLVAPPD